MKGTLVINLNLQILDGTTLLIYLCSICMYMYNEALVKCSRLGCSTSKATRYQGNTTMIIQVAYMFIILVDKFECSLLILARFHKQLYQKHMYLKICACLTGTFFFFLQKTRIVSFSLAMIKGTSNVHVSTMLGVLMKVLLTLLVYVRLDGAHCAI